MAVSGAVEQFRDGPAIAHNRFSKCDHKISTDLVRPIPMHGSLKTLHVFHVYTLEMRGVPNLINLKDRVHSTSEAHLLNFGIATSSPSS